MATVTTGSKAPSHTWTAAHRNTCVIPLPEECWERRGIEVEIDLWEAGGVGREKGDHLGQVRRRYFLTLSCPRSLEQVSFEAATLLAVVKQGLLAG